MWLIIKYFNNKWNSYLLHYCSNPRTTPSQPMNLTLANRITSSTNYVSKPNRQQELSHKQQNQQILNCHISNHAPINKKLKHFVKGIIPSLAKQTTDSRKGYANSENVGHTRSLSVNQNNRKQNGDPFDTYENGKYTTKLNSTGTERMAGSLSSMSSQSQMQSQVTSSH